MARSIRMEADQHQYRGLIHAMNQMETNAQNALRDDVAHISNWAAEGIRGNYEQSPYPRQAAVIAYTIQAKRDRMPFVEIGGSRATTMETGAPAGLLMMGDEMGAVRGFKRGGRRFPLPSARKKTGNAGYWIFPALRMMQPEITHRWKTLVDRYITKEWSRG